MASSVEPVDQDLWPSAEQLIEGDQGGQGKT